MVPRKRPIAILATVLVASWVSPAYSKIIRTGDFSVENCILTTNLIVKGEVEKIETFLGVDVATVSIERVFKGKPATGVKVRLIAEKFTGCDPGIHAPDVGRKFIFMLSMPRQREIEKQQKELESMKSSKEDPRLIEYFERVSDFYQAAIKESIYRIDDYLNFRDMDGQSLLKTPSTSARDIKDRNFVIRTVTDSSTMECEGKERVFKETTEYTTEEKFAELVKRVLAKTTAPEPPSAPISP